MDRTEMIRKIRTRLLNTDMQLVEIYYNCIVKGKNCGCA